MGAKVNAREAARLVHRTERTIRAWVASGALPVELQQSRGHGRGIGPSRWLIDTDELAQMPGAVVDAALLAELEARQSLASAGESMLERLARVEERIDELSGAVDELRRTVDALRQEAPGHGRSGHGNQVG